jgi:predicted branched-subunit amino acid permease
MRSVIRQNVEHGMQDSERDSDAELLRASRRRLLIDSIGIAVSGAGFGLVYGLAARSAGLSVVEVTATSLIVFAGAAQFAALGYIAVGAPWLSIVLVTAFINSRHLLYGAALAPYVANLPMRIRAAMAIPLSDETFALAISHFRRLGFADVPGYFLVGFGTEVLPWTLASMLGAALAGSIADPSVFGLDVIFPASMAGLAVGLVTGRREIVAVLTAVIVSVSVALASEPAVGIICGGVVGSLVALLIPAPATSTEPEAYVP